MNSSGKTLRAAVVYNETLEFHPENDDFLSESAVRDEANAVLSSLRNLGHNPILVPVKNIHDTISVINRAEPDIIFNLCEGYKGNASFEKNMAALWELLEIPFTGNSSITLGTAQNKIMAKKLFLADCILTPAYEEHFSIPESTELKYPLIAKPSMEDASLGIRGNSLIKDKNDLQKTVGAILEKYKQPVLLEEYIEGREFNVSIIGSHDIKIMPISEIDFSQLGNEFPHITSYEAKWIEDHPLYKKTPSVCPAKNLDQNLKEALEDTASRVYKVLGASDYGRVDIRVDNENNVYVLEFNPNPDISPDAGFIKSIRAGGMNYDDFVNFLIRENLGE